MNYELIYWRHPSIPGIKIEEVSGGTDYKEKIWLEMARQVYCENGREEYREIGHYSNGAPFLFGDNSRISISHCHGLLVVATLPPTPEVRLDTFTPRAALGVDAEPADRDQAARLRERFLSDEELAMIPADDVTANVLAWTIKEAAYKAALTTGLDFRRQIHIKRMPRLAPPTPVFNPKDFNLPVDTNRIPDDFYGKVEVEIPSDSSDGAESNKDAHYIISLTIFSYRSDDCIVSLAYSPQCAKFGREG